MKLPQSFTSVTPLSKIFTAILFVLLPFTGFYFGFEYGQKLSSPVVINNQNTNSPEIGVSPIVDPEESDLKTYQNDKFNFRFSYHPACTAKATDDTKNKVFIIFDSCPIDFTFSAIKETPQDLASLRAIDYADSQEINGTKWDILHFDGSSPESGGESWVYRTISNSILYEATTHTSPENLEDILSTFAFLE